MTIETNPHEEAARWKKVAKILAALYVHGIDPRGVETLVTGQWVEVAREAEVHAPSAITIAAIRQVVSEAREHKRPERITITARKRSFAYGWTVTPADPLRPCAWGGLRSIEVERKRALELSGGGRLTEKLWIGGREIRGEAAKLIAELRRVGRVEVDVA